MGIVGVMLAGGLPFPPDHSRAGLGGSRGVGAKVTVGSSVTGGAAKAKAKVKGEAAGGKKKGKKIASPMQIASTRVLIVAPSNAAVDELVLRLCQDGVPGPDGGVYFPRVVRVGGARMDRELDGENRGDGGGVGGAGLGGRGGGRDGLRASVVEVRSVLCAY